MRRAVSLSFVVALATSALACGSTVNTGTPTTTGDTGTGKSDTTTTPGKDTGTAIDTATAPEDTTPTVPDTSTTPEDTATTTTDSSVVDTGSTTVDTGSAPDTKVTVDTKPPPVDTGVPIDNTTGLACTTDTDCDKTGDGITLCSNGVFASGSTLNPSPICIGIDCFAGDGSAIYACDGDKGVCLPTSGTSAVCMGACEFDGTSGSAATGCIGKNVCNVYGWGREGDGDAGVDAAAGKVIGVGYCFGGCKTTADCTGGDKCQVEDGLCVKTLITYAKKVGDTCVAADAAAPAKCNCLYTTSLGKGYCSSVCRYGETTCGTGFSCDAGLPLKDKTGTLFTAVPKGIAGYCQKNCTADSECTALGGYCEEMAGMKGQKTCQVGTRPL